MTKVGKKSFFRGTVGRDAAKQSQGTQFSWLRLPKGISMYKNEPGRATLDILPYRVTSEAHPDRDDEFDVAKPGGLWYKRPYWLHRNIGPSNDAIVCPSTVKQKCPICEYRAKLLKDGVQWDDDVVKALRASQRVLYAVIPLNAKNYEPKVHIWDVSQFAFQEVLNEEVQEDEAYETFPDLAEGYTLAIRFSEETFGGNKWAKASRIDFVPRKKPYDESILEEVPSLDEMLVIKPYDVISASFLDGTTVDKDDEEEEEEKVAPPPKRRPTPAVKEEEEEEEEAPAPEPAKVSKPTKPAGDGKCPHGHTFGTDFDTFPECAECSMWNACLVG